MVLLRREDDAGLQGDRPVLAPRLTSGGRRQQGDDQIRQRLELEVCWQCVTALNARLVPCSTPGVQQDVSARRTPCSTPDLQAQPDVNTRRIIQVHQDVVDRSCCCFYRYLYLL